MRFTRSRHSLPLLLVIGSLAGGAGLAVSGAAATPGASPGALTQSADQGTPLQIDWKLLLPEKERAASKPRVPPPMHDYLSEGDMVALQTGSYDANRELDSRRIKVPGFVVPLEQAADGRLSEFLLVPYFGACIHLPPPPPNQVVYVRMRPGTGPKSADDALWVTGVLHLSVKKSELGAAAYVLEADRIDVYQGPP